MRITAVIVTFNRLEKLKKTLLAFDSQIVFPDKVLVVDNHSTDSTNQFLNNWKSDSKNFEKEVITLPHNMGGSGGFHAGLEKCITDGAEWIWVSDDDAYPQKDAFKIARDFIAENNDGISAICGTVLYEGGIDYHHRRRMSYKGFSIYDISSNKDDYKMDSFELNVFSYAGTIINLNALKTVGTTLEDYFIWYDDTEHSLRLSKVGKIVCVPSIKVFHDIGKSVDYGLTWKKYYGERNSLDMYRRHFPKRVYFFVVIKSYLRVIKKFITGHKESAKLLKCAIKDSRSRKFGIHPIYKPGWKPEGK